MSNFNLSMKLGNAAMLTGDDVAERLRVLAEKISTNYGGDYIDEWYGLGGFVHDANGNQIGKWEVSE